MFACSGGPVATGHAPLNAEGVCTGWCNEKKMCVDQDFAGAPGSVDCRQWLHNRRQNRQLALLTDREVTISATVSVRFVEQLIMEDPCEVVRVQRKPGSTADPCKALRRTRHIVQALFEAMQWHSQYILYLEDTRAPVNPSLLSHTAEAVAKADRTCSNATKWLVIPLDRNAVVGFTAPCPSHPFILLHLFRAWGASNRGQERDQHGRSPWDRCALG